MNRPEKYIIYGIAKYTAVCLCGLVASYLMTSLVFFGICECFGLGIWSYKTSLMLWLALLALSCVHIIMEDKHV